MDRWWGFEMRSIVTKRLCTNCQSFVYKIGSFLCLIVNLLKMWYIYIYIIYNICVPHLKCRTLQRLDMYFTFHGIFNIIVHSTHTYLLSLHCLVMQVNEGEQLLQRPCTCWQVDLCFLLKNLKTFCNFYTTILNPFKQTLNKKTRYGYVSCKYWGVYVFFVSQMHHKFRIQTPRIFRIHPHPNLPFPRCSPCICLNVWYPGCHIWSFAFSIFYGIHEP